MPNPVLSNEASSTAVSHFTDGLNAAFSKTFDAHYYSESREWQKRMFRVMPSSAAFEMFHGFLSAPEGAPLLRGMAPISAGIGEVTLTVYVYDYASSEIQYFITDKEESRAPEGIEKRINDTAEKLANLDDQVLPELLTGAVSTRLNPGVSFTNIFGGTAGLFSSSHSYSGNNGAQTLDNSIAGRGTSAANLQDDFYTIMQTYDDMVDSEGNPFWPQERTERATHMLIVPAELRQPFDSLWRSTTVVQAGGTAPADNYIKTVFGQNVQWKVFQRLTDTNNYYCIRTDNVGDAFPFLKVERRAPEMMFRKLNSGSDWSYRTRMESVYWWLRRGYAPGVPQCAVEITN